MIPPGQGNLCEESQAGPEDSYQPEPEPTLLPMPEPMKVVVVGACGVGKTTWISRLKSKNPRKYKMSKEDHEFPTVGADVTTIEMPTSRATKKVPHNVTFKVWEVSGSDDQAGIRPTYYSGAHAAVILFKLASNSETTKAPLQTYWEVLRWHNEVVQVCGKDLPIMVVRSPSPAPSLPPLPFHLFGPNSVSFRTDWSRRGPHGEIPAGEARLLALHSGLKQDGRQRIPAGELRPADAVRRPDTAREKGWVEGAFCQNMSFSGLVSC